MTAWSLIGRRIILMAILFGFAAWLVGCQGVVSPRAERDFLNDLGDTMTLTVYPTIVRERGVTYDAVAAEGVAKFFRFEGLADANVVNEHVVIEGTWHMNQADMFRESVDSFAGHLRAHPIKTDYALITEYMFGKTKAGGVHVYILARDGTPSYAILLNDHHSTFSKADPKTVLDCTQVAVSVLTEELITARELP